ncbi:hypothetical protein A2715_02410 [Candidatus Woesebacteria bacterium RIFCSPHIGHO2_01_FULL_39_32]|nr:MAG: hypothetical protein A2715_02410 [Candidatus Woesebacteria bacterium RIFCSPHIGHO2_01_FULL_39_32]
MITLVLVFVFTDKHGTGIDLFLVLCAFIYIAFIFFVIINSFFAAKKSFKNIGLVKRLTERLEKFKYLQLFISSTLILTYILTVVLSVSFIFGLFVYPLFKDVVAERFKPEGDNRISSDIYNIRTTMNVLGYDIKDLKQKLYFSENPESYRYEDGKYTYELKLDTNKLFEYGRTDYYNYNIKIHFKETGVAAAGWRSGGIEVHQTDAQGLKSTVSKIKAEYRKLPLLNDKDVFVITVVDKDTEYFYVLYPKNTTYNDDYTTAANLDYVEGFVASYDDYEFLEDKSKIRLFLTVPLNGSATAILTLKEDEKGTVSTTLGLEEVE